MRSVQSLSPPLAGGESAALSMVLVSLALAVRTRGTLVAQRIATTRWCHYVSRLSCLGRQP
jgi:hypothetical protein